MTYRINGVKVTREEFMSKTRGIDFNNPPMIGSDYKGYSCPVTGQWVEGKRAHEENLKRTGCRLLEKGEKEQYAKNLARDREEAAEKTSDFLTRRIAEKLPDNIGSILP